MSSKARLLELNARLAQNLTDKGVEATADETTTALVNKVPSLYDKGYEQGKAEGGIEELENLIDGSGVLEDSEANVTEKVEQLIDKAEWENFWYVQSGAWDRQFTMLFYGSTNIKRLPKLNFQNATVMNEFLTKSSVEMIDYYINSEQLLDAASTFSNCKKLTFVYGIDLSKASRVHDLFKNCPLLETIQEPLNMLGSTTDGHFIGCFALKNIRFVTNTIKKSLYFGQQNLLTPESIQSIIDGLATVETAQTLTLHADVKAKLTEEQLATITNKNWNLA